MKKLILQSIILFIGLGSVVYAFQNEPSKFRGIQWGSSLAKTKNMFQTEPPDKIGVACFKRKGDRLKIGEASLKSIQYCAFKDSDVRHNTTDLSFWYVATTLNVREGPSKTTSKIDVLKMNQRVQIRKEKNGWAYIVYEKPGGNLSGWVLKGYLNKHKVSHEIGRSKKSSNSESVSTSIMLSNGAILGKIALDAAIGCLDKKSYKMSLNCIMENDTYCLANLVMQGRCKLFQKGEIVYIEDLSPFGGMMEIRERGSSTTWKISSGFVKRIKK